MTEKNEKGRLAALLTRDHNRLGDIYRQEGNKREAIKAYTKGGDWRQAGKLAVEVGDVPLATELFLAGALGKGAEGYQGASAAQAGELLASSGFPEEALYLLEIGGAFRPAAGLALKLKQPARAAVLFERAKDYEMAANYYEQTGRPKDALRVLEAEAQAQAQAAKSGRPASEEKRRANEQRRAALLARLGRGADAHAVMKNVGTTAKGARMLEAAGNFKEAAEAYLETGEPQEALRLVGKAQGLSPGTIAEIYLKSGHAEQAGRLFAQQQAPRAAGEAFEKAGKWELAAQQWKAAGDLRRAAQAFTRARRLHEAARCYEQAGDAKLAAETFAAAGDAAAAATSFLKAGQPVAASTQFLSVGNRSEAAQALQRVPTGSPEFEQASLLLVPLLMEEGMLDAALHRVRMLPPAGPGAATEALDRLYYEGRILEELGRPAEALPCFQRLVALSRDHRDVVERLRGVTAKARAPQASTAPPPLTPSLAVTQATGVRPGSAPPAAEPDELAAGGVLAGRYEIQEELGRGGMGQVFKARDRELNELVAIKTVLRRAGADSTDEERLIREVQICRKITHPNVVRVYDLGRVPGGIFITMELLEGARLDQLIGNNKKLSLPRVKQLLGEICEGLKEAHALGIVHRDLKPGNVMVTPKRLKILDFGIARMNEGDPRLTRTGITVGSPLYMSPEQIQGQELDGRSDLYSLGVLAFTLLAGREPFIGMNPTTIVLQHLQSPPPRLTDFRPDLPPPWQALVSKLLSKEVEDRYASAEEVLGVLVGLGV